MNFEILEAYGIIPDPDWIPVSFSTYWSDLGGVWQTGRYRMTSGGRVELDTLAISKSTATVAGETILTVPVGYRPTLQVTGWCIGDNGANRVDMNSSGQLIFWAASAGSGGFLLTAPLSWQATTPVILPSFSAVGWPIKFKTTIKNVTSLQLSSAQEHSSDAKYSVAHGCVDWLQDGNYLLVRRVDGLQPARTYKMIFTAFGE